MNTKDQISKEETVRTSVFAQLNEAKVILTVSEQRSSLEWA